MSARQPFGLDTGATPDFVARATQLRKLYELIERKAGVKYLDGVQHAAFPVVTP